MHLKGFKRKHIFIFCCFAQTDLDQTRPINQTNGRKNNWMFLSVRGSVNRITCSDDWTRFLIFLFDCQNWCLFFMHKKWQWLEKNKTYSSGADWCSLLTQPFRVCRGGPRVIVSPSRGQQQAFEIITFPINNIKISPPCPITANVTMTSHTCTLTPNPRRFPHFESTGR